MKYTKDNIPLNVPVFVTFDKGQVIKGLIVRDDNVFYFHNNSRAGSGPKYKGYKHTWTFRVSSGTLTEHLKDIRLFQKEEYSIF